MQEVEIWYSINMYNLPYVNIDSIDDGTSICPKNKPVIVKNNKSKIINLKF